MVNSVFKISAKIRCRQIQQSDLDAVAVLLARGFPAHAESHWRGTLSRLSAYATPAGYPKYGYLLESDGTPVGVILLIFATIEIAGEQRIRCYLSSWYVVPVFRGYASLLIAAALKRRDVTYVNVSPDPYTWPTIEAQGFLRYCKGQYRAIPLLSLRSDNGRVYEIEPAAHDQIYPGSLQGMLSDHAAYDV